MWLLKRSGRIRQEDPNRQSVEDATPTTSFGTPRAASRQHEESASAHGGLLGMAKNHMLYSRAFEALQPLGNEFKEAMESDDGPDASFVQKYREILQRKPGEATRIVLESLQADPRELFEKLGQISNEQIVFPTNGNIGTQLTNLEARLVTPVSSSTRKRKVSSSTRKRKISSSTRKRKKCFSDKKMDWTVDQGVEFIKLKVKFRSRAEDGARDSSSSAINDYLVDVVAKGTGEFPHMVKRRDDYFSVPGRTPANFCSMLTNKSRTLRRKVAKAQKSDMEELDSKSTLDFFLNNDGTDVDREKVEEYVANSYA